MNYKASGWISESLQWNYEPQGKYVSPYRGFIPTEKIYETLQCNLKPPRKISESFQRNYKPLGKISESLKWNYKPLGRISESLQWSYKP